MEDEDNIITLREFLMEIVVNKIHLELDIPLKDIAEELMTVATLIAPGCKPKEDYQHVDGFDKMQDAEYLKWDKKYRVFKNTEINTSVEDTLLKIDEAHMAGRYTEALALKEKLIHMYPEHAKTWVSIMGNLDGYYTKIDEIVAQMLVAYVVMIDKTKMVEAMETSHKLFDVMGNDKLAALSKEKLEKNYERYRNDVPHMRSIYDFLTINPGFQQNKIFKELALDGRKSSYMIAWAEKYGKIIRTRYKNTWLLSVTA